MAKQSNSKKPETYGSGNVSPVQVAFIVDRYLSDNNFAQTRSNFRTEASDLISKSPFQEAPSNLLSLAAILDEYILLKEQKLMVDQERSRLEQDRVKIQSLLSGVQNAMNCYSSGGGSVPFPSPVVNQYNVNSLVRMDLLAGSPAGYPAYHPPNLMMPVLKPNTSQIEQSSISKSSTNQSSKRKRSNKNVTGAPIPSKRTRGSRSTTIDITAKDNLNDGQLLSVTQLSNSDNSLNGSPVASPISNTPPRSTASQTDKPISPVEVSSTNCIVIVSPNKKVTYYSIERNQSITTSSPDKTNLRVNMREHVKGRLDFDGPNIPMDSNILSHDVASTSELDNGNGGDAGGKFDFDLPDFDDMGFDFNIGDMVVDFDLGIDFLTEPESHSGSTDNNYTIRNLENSDLFPELVTDITS